MINWVVHFNIYFVNFDCHYFFQEVLCSIVSSKVLTTTYFFFCQFPQKADVPEVTYSLHSFSKLKITHSLEETFYESFFTFVPNSVFMYMLNFNFKSTPISGLLYCVFLATHITYKFLAFLILIASDSKYRSMCIFCGLLG